MTAEFVDQDDYFDDDSDVPSHFDPSEELEESLVEEAVNFEPEHVEIEFDDEESSLSSSACITEDWKRSNWMETRRLPMMALTLNLGA